MTGAIDAGVTLGDKYARRSGRVFISGVQALVRLPLLQRARDRERGWNTAGFISGYRGSPLATYDTMLWGAKTMLADNGIVFQPGLNEELAATSVWGTQQLAFQPDATVDGVFAIWYAKGPGVDRSMDALKHANAAGTAPKGGVLAIFGDDHGAQSSTLLHQSEQMFEAACVPVLNPADIHDQIVFGLYGIELSRYAGCWVGLKVTTEVVESSAAIDAEDPPLARLPDDVQLPPGGLGIRWPDVPAEQERRMLGPRLEAVASFVRANPIDRIELAAGPARLGIVTSGKAYLDVMQALDELRISQEQAERLGLRLYKLGLTWPIEAEGARRFALGLDEILVVEEKRAFIEPQFVSILRHVESAPRVVGKTDEQGIAVIPSDGELSPLLVALALVRRLKALGVDMSEFDHRVLDIEARAAASAPAAAIERRPFFCSGCPHNSSTVVPEGSRAMAGTGCHSMAMSMPARNSATLTQMGGEGANWIGQSAFTQGRHVFVNLGDGTYSHSGILAIRAAAAAGVNATYKILYNDAVAMTGGQPNDAHLEVDQIARELAAEGAKRIVIVAEEPGRHDKARFPADAQIVDRRELARIQQELREVEGLTVIIYDQVCAAEKRRRRKRGQFPQAAKRVFINDEVCEGCGDCSVQSNCISVGPLETPLGRKRIIDQSTCNADYSCVNGFCPSFVSVHGASPRSRLAASDDLDDLVTALPAPTVPALGDGSYNLLVTGIGGTGVITVGALIGMAGHLEGKSVNVLDFTGLAQKNGAVTSHVKIASAGTPPGPARLIAGSADLVLACDGLVAASPPAITRMRRGRTRVIFNGHVQPPAAFVLDPDIALDHMVALQPIRTALGAEAIDEIDATRIATRLMGDSIYTNLFMLGFAWQRGAIPLGHAALMRAIELNGTAVHANKRAFGLGRLAAVRPERFVEQATVAQVTTPDLAGLVKERRARLVAYQNEAYARRYDRLVEAVMQAATPLGAKGERLTHAVARNLYKLMAYKDEYEVARLYTDGNFRRKLGDQFEGVGKIQVHLAPPVLARLDPVTGAPRKRAFGAWIFTVFAVLARLRGLRGTAFDLFGYTAERRMERALVVEYEATIGGALGHLTSGNADRLTEIAELPEMIRGFGHIKMRNAEAAAKRRARLLANFERPAADGARLRMVQPVDGDSV